MGGSVPTTVSKMEQIVTIVHNCQQLITPATLSSILDVAVALDLALYIDVILNSLQVAQSS